MSPLFYRDALIFLTYSDFQFFSIALEILFFADSKNYNWQHLQVNYNLFFHEKCYFLNKRNYETLQRLQDLLSTENKALCRLKEVRIIKRCFVLHCYLTYFTSKIKSGWKGFINKCHLLTFFPVCLLIPVTEFELIWAFANTEAAGFEFWIVLMVVLG